MAFSNNNNRKLLAVSGILIVSVLLFSSIAVAQSSNDGVYTFEEFLAGLRTFFNSISGGAIFNIGDTCGDGSIGRAEQCDDGNLNNGDGCSSSCTSEFGAQQFQVSACTSAPINMISWWDADSVSGTTVTDIQDSNHGSLVNGATTAAGKVGNAFSLDGVDDFVSVPHSTNLETSDDAGLTVDAWVYLDPAVLPTGRYTLVEKTDRDLTIFSPTLNQFYNPGWALFVRNTYFRFEVCGDAAATSACTVAVQVVGAFTTAGWHHVVGTYNSAGRAEIYVDGVFQESSTQAVRPYNNSANLVMGKGFSNDFDERRYFPGKIDEVEVFNRVLSATEISNIFNAGIDGKCKGVVAVCGNGAPEAPETCDDGGTASGDGCSSTCTIESGYTCTGTPSVCTTIACGNGVLQLGEFCDDGNINSGDGCTSTCAVETGWNCNGLSPTTCTTICNDGLIRGTETCDDGGGEGGSPGCSPTCTIEPGWSCTGQPSVCTLNCGNGVLNPGETCDDGGRISGDGCDSSCRIEVCGDGFCSGPGENSANCLVDCPIETNPPTVSAVTPTSAIINQARNFSATYSDDSGVSSCTFSADSINQGAMLLSNPGGFSGTASKSFTFTTAGAHTAQVSCVDTNGNLGTGPLTNINVAGVCGNGLTEPPETCDDGNTNSYDGCSSTCQVEVPGGTVCGNGICDVGESNANCPEDCLLAPPVNICGNSIIETGETCDDGNTISGDGCSSVCLLEVVCTDADNDGFRMEGGACGPVDCDDNDISVFPNAPELCDAKDNQCPGDIGFGQVDESFDVGQSCSAGIGACLRTGTIQCNSLTTSACSVVAGTPTTEVCDNIDNNCNSETDENDVLAPTTTASARTPSFGVYDLNFITPPFVNQNVIMKLTAADSPSPGACGLNQILYCIDAANTCTPNIVTASGSEFIIPFGVHYVRFQATDNKAPPNVEAVQSELIRTDGEFPAVRSVSLTPGIVSGAAQITVRKTVTDELSGVASVTAVLRDPSNQIAATTSLTNIGGNDWGGTLTLSPSAPDGTYTVYDTVSDIVGNTIEVRDGTIIVDNTGPTVIITSIVPEFVKPSASVTITAVASDALSGISSLTARDATIGESPTAMSLIGGSTDPGRASTWQRVITGALPEGFHTAEVTAYD
ncbi:MAG TPA: DUF4215 domain-containing protein, partial [Candidatus Nanoarchaeia archaeon]|nr:DUF4215 domain-containing protein [Candidatus Nanoarchaeia archaeon]